MLEAHESEIALVVAVSERRRLSAMRTLPQMMWQLNDANVNALVILAPDHAVPLRELFPFS